MLAFWGCTSQRIFSFLRAFAPPVLQMQMNTVYSHNSSHLGKVFIVRAIFLWQFQHRRMCSLLYRCTSCKVIVHHLLELEFSAHYSLFL